MRAWVVVGMVGLVGCRQPAGQFEASAEIRCEVGEPLLPSRFPIAPYQAVLPTADGFVFDTHRWRFDSDGLLRHEALAEPIISVASLDGVTAVADAQHVERWEGDRRLRCASATGRITTVGLTREDVLWNDVSRSGSTLYRAARTAEGCGPAQVMTTHRSSFFRPTRLGVEWVVAVDGELLVLDDQGVVRRSQLPRGELLELCGGSDGLLFATELGLFRQAPDGTQTELQRFQEYGATACEGETMTVSFSSDGGAVFERYATSGELIDRRSNARVGYSGLAGGGWKLDSLVVRSWADRVLETSDPALVDRVWSYGADTSVSMGPGPLLRWSQGSWQLPPDETWRRIKAVPDGRAGVTVLGSSPGTLEVWAGDQLLETRHWFNWAEYPSTVRAWVVDPCTDRALIEFEVEERSTLFVRTGDAWREVAVPHGSPLLAARFDGDDLLVRTSVDRQLRHVVGGDWVEEPADVSLPSAPGRILPLDSAFAAQTPSGVEVLRPGSQPELVHSGSRLVGTAGDHLIVATERGLFTFSSAP